MAESKCSSYRQGFAVCADGFMQKPICRGAFGCSMCGCTSDKEVPNCMKDELPEHWIKGDGSPVFYMGQQP